MNIEELKINEEFTEDKNIKEIIDNNFNIEEEIKEVETEEAEEQPKKKRGRPKKIDIEKEKLNEKKENASLYLYFIDKINDILKKIFGDYWVDFDETEKDFLKDFIIDLDISFEDFKTYFNYFILINMFLKRFLHYKETKKNKLLENKKSNIEAEVLEIIKD